MANSTIVIMKKIQYYLIFTFLLFSLSSCSNVTMGFNNADFNKKEYSISVTSENNNISFLNNTNKNRTILPNALELNSNLDFYMWGENLIDNSAIELQQIYITPTDINDPKEGTFKFSFDRQFYRLTLVAVEHGTIFSSGKELLKSSISIDLRTCNDIKFILTNKSVIAKGNAKIGFYTDSWNIPNDFSVKAGIYNKITDEPITEITIGNIYSYSSIPLNPEYQLSLNDINSGTYIVKLYFFKTINGKKKIYTYSDDILIAPNQTTTACIAVPNIIVNTPIAPTYLIAGYKDNQNITSDFYDVEFCWDDKSYNEEDFELEILDITPLDQTTYDRYVIPLLEAFTSGSLNTSLVDMKTNWDQIALALNDSYIHTYSRNYFDNTNVKTDGSFTSNSVYAVIKLLYGKRYIARISAVNSAGNSEYAYLDLYNTGNRSFTQTQDISFTPQNWKQDSTSMNRYKIEYYYTNGQFLDDSTNTDVTDIISSSIISTQLRNSDFPILNAKNYLYSETSTATLKYLYNGAYYSWQKWKNNSITGSDFYLTSYNGCENLFLYAFYGDNVKISDIELTIKSNENEYWNSDIVISAINETATSLIPFQQDTDISNTVSNNTITVSKTTYKYVNLLINKTYNKYTTSTFHIALQGGQVYRLPVKSTQFYGNIYNYGQINITEKDSSGNDIYKTGETYNLFITSILNGSTINFQIYLKIEE